MYRPKLKKRLRLFLMVAYITFLSASLSFVSNYLSRTSLVVNNDDLETSPLLADLEKIPNSTSKTINVANIQKNIAKTDNFLPKIFVKSTGKNFTEIEADFDNRWMNSGKNLQDLSWKYFVDVSELIDKDFKIQDIKVSLTSKSSATISQLKPWHGDKNIYFIEIELNKLPTEKVSFKLSSVSANWNPKNDWSYPQNMKKHYTNFKIPVYDNGKLINGKEPNYSKVDSSIQ